MHCLERRKVGVFNPHATQHPSGARRFPGLLRPGTRSSVNKYGAGHEGTSTPPSIHCLERRKVGVFNPHATQHLSGTRRFPGLLRPGTRSYMNKYGTGHEGASKNLWSSWTIGFVFRNFRAWMVNMFYRCQIQDTYKMRDIATACPALKGRENVLWRVIARSVGVQTPTFRLSRQILALGQRANLHLSSFKADISSWSKGKPPPFVFQGRY